MKKTTKIIIALVVVAVIATGVILITGQKSADKSTGNTAGNNRPVTTITYSDSGFSPADVTVVAGDSLTVVNQSAEKIEPSSNPHPIHTDNPELNLGDIEAGKSKTVIPTKTGTWGYHNHYHKDHSGTITVE